MRYAHVPLAAQSRPAQLGSTAADAVGCCLELGGVGLAPNNLGSMDVRPPRAV